MNYVEVKNLTKRFGNLLAVDNLSVTVFEGEIFGFLGPNGAGKSTTLNIISTLMDYDKGEIKIADYDLNRNEREIKALIGLVPQDIALFSNLSARENVAFFAGLYGLSGRALKEAVSEALEFVGLAEQSKKRAGKMSGGQKRRLNIACGIAHKPKLIILDEPTVGVDAQSREHIMGSIRTLRDRGATIIYTSHYMPEAQEICDRIAIIDHGKLVGLGTEEELLKIVTDVKSISIELAAHDTIDRAALIEKIKLLPDVHRVAQDIDERKIRIDVSLAFSDISPIIKTFIDNGAHIYALNSESPDLETTFLALTGRELRQS
jgi:ABC-2 type transport system ATP-binding protein